MDQCRSQVNHHRRFLTVLIIICLCLFHCKRTERPIDRKASGGSSQLSESTTQRQTEEFDLSQFSPELQQELAGKQIFLVVPEEEATRDKLYFTFSFLTKPMRGVDGTFSNPLAKTVQNLETFESVAYFMKGKKDEIAYADISLSKAEHEGFMQKAQWDDENKVFVYQGLYFRKKTTESSGEVFDYEVSNYPPKSDIEILQNKLTQLEKKLTGPTPIQPARESNLSSEYTVATRSSRGSTATSKSTNSSRSSGGTKNSAKNMTTTYVTEQADSIRKSMSKEDLKQFLDNEDSSLTLQVRIKETEKLSSYFGTVKRNGDDFESLDFIIKEKAGEKATVRTKEGEQTIQYRYFEVVKKPDPHILPEGPKIETKTGNISRTGFVLKGKQFTRVQKLDEAVSHMADGKTADDGPFLAIRTDDKQINRFFQEVNYRTGDVADPKKGRTWAPLIFGHQGRYFQAKYSQQGYIFYQRIPTPETF